MLHQWTWQDDSKAFRDYDNGVNATIEAAYSTRQATADFSVGGQSYEVTFSTMQQRNKATGVTRAVQRDGVGAVAGAGAGGWVATPSQSHLVLPKTVPPALPPAASLTVIWQQAYFANPSQAMVDGELAVSPSSAEFAAVSQLLPSPPVVRTIERS